MKLVVKFLSKSLFVWVVLMSAISVAAQENASFKLAQKEFNRLEEKFDKGELTRDSYMKNADSLVFKFLSNGHHFTRDELTELLNLYREMAWSANRFSTQRKSYYEHFMNNALQRNKGGEAIYFSEKVASEIEKATDRASLVEVYTKSLFYIRNKNYVKARDLYRENKDYIEGYHEKVTSGRRPVEAGMKALHLISVVSKAFIELHDTTAINESLQAAEKLREVLMKYPEMDSQQELQAAQMMTEIRINRYLFFKDFPKVETIITELEQMLEGNKESSDPVIAATEFNLLKWWTLYYLEAGNFEKAGSYLERLSALPQLTEDEQSTVLRLNARLRSGEGNYREAYEIMRQVEKEDEKYYAQVMTELDELLYSHTASEVTNLALQRAEHQKRIQAIWIAALAVLAICIILLVYMWVLREKRKTRFIIATLNRETNFQIALLEEEKRLARRMEQERLAMELHDDISASVAAALYQLEGVDPAAEYEERCRQLDKLKNTLEGVYHSVRDKSHKLQESALEVDGNWFKEQVEKLATVLPEKLYSKEIEIDPGAVSNLTPDKRVELLRIIQESVVNILKHARASIVTIFVYKSGREIVLHVSDNGKGFDLEKARSKKGMGLKSLEKRAANLNARLIINSDSDGTSIEVILNEDVHVPLYNMH